jgi:hypothetical protein
MNRYAPATPYTQAERDADRRERTNALRTIHNRRKSTPSGQNYNIPGDKASKAKSQRILGEREAS